MKVLKYLHAKSTCSYQFSRKTTEYGALVFDDDLEGKYLTPSYGERELINMALFNFNLRYEKF